MFKLNDLLKGVANDFTIVTILYNDCVPQVNSFIYLFLN